MSQKSLPLSLFSTTLCRSRLRNSTLSPESPVNTRFLRFTSLASTSNGKYRNGVTMVVSLLSHYRCHCHPEERMILSIHTATMAVSPASHFRCHSLPEEQMSLLINRVTTVVSSLSHYHCHGRTAELLILSIHTPTMVVSY